MRSSSGTTLNGTPSTTNSAVFQSGMHNCDCEEECDGSCQSVLCPECNRRIFDLYGVLGKSTSIHMKCLHCRQLVTIRD